MTLSLTRPQARHTDRPDAPARAQRPVARARKFRPDIEGMRAFAVVAVVLYHANLGVRGGYVGVDVFFVISGFLITRQLTQSRSGRVASRRCRRSTPDGSAACCPPPRP